MPEAQKNESRWQVVFDNFYQGQGPASHINSLAEDGNSGHYSTAVNVDLTDPTSITQGPGLANLTNGTEAGAITELTNFILDRPVTSDATYGIGATKLQKISSTTVTNSGGVFPHTITGATDGESVIEFGGYLFYFYNKSSGADCGRYDLSSTFDDDYFSTVPTGAAALQSAPHPVAKKEDIMLFGNGRYVGTFINSTTTLAPTKLDFGANTETADVAFHANQWYIAVNTGVTLGNNRASGQVYLYDGGAINSILSDEVAIGLQKIGFIHVMNGIVYVAYKDLSGYNAIGIISGRSVVPLGYFTGNLPTYEKKTVYKNFIIFESSGLIYAIGAPAPKYPVSLFQLADGGYATCGALAAPFGTPMVSSYDGASAYKLAQFSGYDTTSSWKSLIHDLGGQKGYVDEVLVLTNHASSGASCALSLDLNQDQSNSSTMTLSSGQRRWRFTADKIGAHDIEDFRLVLDFAGGSASNPMKIRKVVVRGGLKEQ